MKKLLYELIDLHHLIDELSDYEQFDADFSLQVGTKGFAITTSLEILDINRFHINELKGRINERYKRVNAFLGRKTPIERENKEVFGFA